MSMQELKELTDQAKWDKHLEDSYTKCKSEHKSRIIPFGLKRKLKQEKIATIKKAIPTSNLKKAEKLGTVAQTGVTGAGVVTGLISAVDPWSAAGVALALPGAAITLYALPISLMVIATIYKGYKTYEKHKVNVEIWNYWDANLKGKPPQPGLVATPEETGRWLSWFGTDGIGNMSKLTEKLDQAKKEFDFRVKELETEKKKLAEQIDAEGRKPAPRTPQDTQKKQASVNDLKRKADSLAKKYFDLGKDYSYLQYRLERFQMYHDMLELTIRSVLKLANIDQIQKDTKDAMKQQLDTYENLYYAIANLPEPA